LTKVLTLSEAQAAVDKIGRDRAQLVATRVSLAEHLEIAKREMGERYLEGDRSNLTEVSGLTVELEALERALNTLDGRERTAQVELKRATAGALRNQAEDKRRQLEELNAATGLLLNQLTALEQPESPFTHSILSSQPLAGAWLGLTTLKTNRDSWLGFWELQADQPGKPNLCAPLSRRLRVEIERLETEASTIEAKLPALSAEAA
jgi:hypothetical protein